MLLWLGNYYGADPAGSDPPGAAADGGSHRLHHRHLLGLDLAVPDHRRQGHHLRRGRCAASDAEVIVPPRSSAVLSDTTATAPIQRDRCMLELRRPKYVRIV